MVIKSRGWDGRDIEHTWWETRNTYNVYCDAEGKRPLGRPKRRMRDNIKMYVEEIGWDVAKLIYMHLDKDRWRSLVNTIINFWFRKRRGISWIGEGLSASQQRVCSMKLIIHS
jgi:hypothetical protein